MAKGHRLEGGADEAIRIIVEGEAIPARAGEPIAVSLLAAGVDIFSRSVKYHRPRGPYCLSGRCSHCMVQVDGEPNVYACLQPARPNLRVERQNAFPNVDRDLFGVIDWFTPKGLDHHSLFAGVPVVEKVVAKVARQLAGLGKLPPAAQGPKATYFEHRCELLVVGGGPAGIAAAVAAAEAGLQVSLLHERPKLGGRLATGLIPAGEPGLPWLQTQERKLEELGVHLFLESAAFGAYREGPLGTGGPGLLVAALAPGRRLLVVQPRALIVATGASELLPLFPNNDLPGVFSGRAVAALLHQHRLLPGKRAVVAGDGPEREALVGLLQAAGCEVLASVGLEPGPAGHLVRARGRAKVSGALVADAGGSERMLRCDLIAICDHRSALVDLARHAGAEVEWKEEAAGFGVVVGPAGETAAPDVFACGEVSGPASIRASIAQGEAAGLRAADALRSQR